MFNEYKATVWVPPRLRSLSCSPLPEGNLHEQGGEASGEVGGVGRSRGEHREADFLFPSLPFQMIQKSIRTGEVKM